MGGIPVISFGANTVAFTLTWGFGKSCFETLRVISEIWGVPQLIICSNQWFCINEYWTIICHGMCVYSTMSYLYLQNMDVHTMYLNVSDHLYNVIFRGYGHPTQISDRRQVVVAFCFVPFELLLFLLQLFPWAKLSESITCFNGIFLASGI